MQISLNLPNPLLLLILGLLYAPRSSVAQTLQLDKIASFSITSTQRSLNIALPQSSQPVLLSVELCNLVDGQQTPKFFASTGTGASTSSSRSTTRSSASASSTPGVVVGDGDEPVDVDTGLGVWTSPQTFINGGTLKVQIDPSARSGTWRFNVGLSINVQTPLHAFSSSHPLYGDAASTSALVFSEPISDTAIPFKEPDYPRYDLPSPNPPAPSPPDSTRSSNSTLIVIPTSSLLSADGRSTSTLTSSSCFLQSLAAGNTGPTITPSLVLRSQEEGWRTQFLVDGLQPSTNYTFYTLTAQGSGTRLSAPAYFKTKSAAFTCTLVHSLPFCPGVSWAAPFPPLAGDPTTYDSTNFPTAIQDMLTQSLGNFTASLKTFPCGREIYSIIQSCASCERAYRNWLCSVLVPRCGEIDQSRSLALEPPAALVSRSVGSANTTSASPRLDQTVFSSGDGVTDYMELLPCLETCHAVDRACPPNVQWTCPRKGLNAEKSYGVGFVDIPGDDVSGGGVEGKGNPGKTQDAYGNVWCNAII
ncbi:hypothetical protein M408DRAFT_328587 [Serendipita vermifera MAFF 305830]|uniref:FZ domain-containing protein n=1 Tax=Serendipita vermifera MAFF 305830 TaxID=933852 RepID=A0A0C3BE52_SERVB|nr:hypothetical protein M408DRAFT_328587 [Serendipita vermifera MAFF 305830]